MEQDLQYRLHSIEASSIRSHSKLARSIDPLAYSPEFERCFLPEIALLQSTLDFVSLQLQSTHQRRLLTQLEHNKLALAELAFTEGSHLGLGQAEKLILARSFLAEAVRSALKMLGASPGSLEKMLRRLGASTLQLEAHRGLAPWYEFQNIVSLVECSALPELCLKRGSNLIKLHYLCQLSVFTSTPKTPEDYPLTILVSPEEFFSLNTIWARMPQLWDHQVVVTQSGKPMMTKLSKALETTFRHQLGTLADLHLEIARLIRRTLPRGSRLAGL